MQRFSLWLPLGALIFLFGCGTQKGAFDEAITAADAYQPIYADGVATNSSAMKSLSGSGLPGFVGFADGKVRPIAVRLTPDGSVASVSIEGETVLDFPVRNWGGQDFGTWSHEDGAVFMTFEGDNAGFLQLDGSVLGQGTFGLLTSPEFMPDGSPSYGGSWNAAGTGTEAAGTLTLVLDTQLSEVEGVMTGTLLIDGALFPFFGAIDGATAQSRLVASAAINTPTVLGRMDFMGGFFENAEVVSGGVGGTLNRRTLGGRFYVTAASP